MTRSSAAAVEKKRKAPPQKDARASAEADTRAQSSTKLQNEAPASTEKPSATREAVTLSAFPDKAWVKTASLMTKQYCQSLRFVPALTKRATEVVDAVATEIVRLAETAELENPIELDLSYRDEAVVIEFGYAANFPLDPRPWGVEVDGKKPDREHVAMDALWVTQIKTLADRVVFRQEGGRRVLELRLYRRAEAKLNQYWPMNLVPKLCEDVVLHVGDDGNALLQNETTGASLFLDQGAAFIVSQINGATPFHSIYMAYIGKFGLVPPEKIGTVFMALENSGMLEEDEVRLRSTPILRALTRAGRYIRGGFILPSSEDVVEAVHGRLSFLFHPVVVTAIVLFALSGFIPLMIEIDNPHEILTKPFHAIRANIWLLVEVYVVLLLIAAAHELGHALACRHFGGRVRRIGVMMYLGLIVFFADTSAAWVFSDKWKRMAVALAGTLVNLVFMSIAFWIWEFSRHDVPPEQSIWFVIGFFCLYTTLVNLVPFVKLDGYYALTDLLDMPNLREESFAYIEQRFHSLIGGRHRSWAVQPRLDRAAIYWIYGILGAIFSVGIVLLVTQSLIYTFVDHDTPITVMFITGVLLLTGAFALLNRLYQFVHSRSHWRMTIVS